MTIRQFINIINKKIDDKSDKIIKAIDKIYNIGDKIYNINKKDIIIPKISYIDVFQSL